MTHLNHIIWAQTVEAAKLAAANSPCWLRAIEKAAAQIESNPCITELCNGVLITSPSGKTYLANGKCPCDAFKHKMACWHRATYQLISRYNDALRDPIARRKAERAELIADIKRSWPKTWPPLYTELLARFGKSNLEMLDVDMLRRVRLAIAM